MTRALPWGSIYDESGDALRGIPQLEPLLKLLSRQTDELIDEIINELYELTDEEIEIVEEAVGD